MLNISEKIDAELARALEASEIAYWSKLYKSRGSLGCRTREIAGAFAGAVPGINMLAMNRVLGFGMMGEVTEAHVDEVLEFFSSAGSPRFFIQLCPHAPQAELPEMLTQKGFYHFNNWVKSVRGTEGKLPQVRSELEIRQIGPGEDALRYGEIIRRSFGWEDERIGPWLADSVGMPGYFHYLLYYGNMAVAAGALHVYGDIATMALAGTLANYRGRGAQSLLLSTRMEQARELGCNYFVTETAEEKPDKPVVSFRNMLRFGFRPAYKRANWIFEF